MTAPTIERVAVTQADRDRTAEALGYRDWADATDYRLTGKQDRQRDHFLQHFARHRLSASSGMEEIEEIVGAAEALLAAAKGLSHGTDWNNGHHAKRHGHRRKLLDAIPRLDAALARIRGRGTDAK